MRILGAIFLITLGGGVANAHPVPYKDAVGVMTWNQPFMSDNWITYSFRHDAAFAARMMRFEVPQGRMNFYGPQIDYLVKRWNSMESQANIYAYGSYGAMTMNGGKAKGSGLGGVEADAESRKLFVSAKYEKMWGKLGPDFYHAEARIGVAPYEAEFSEIASWFMIQYQYHPMLTKDHAITPMVRLFYKSVLTEIGVSTNADWMLNFMFHF